MRLRLLLVVATAAVAAALALPGQAAAFPCAVTLTDSTGFKWKLDDFGAVTDGGKAGSSDPYGSAIIDGYLVLSASPAGGPPLSGGNYLAGSNACTVAHGGEEMLFPEVAIGSDVPGLVVSRRVYVPASGRAFARWIETLRNTSSTTQSYDFFLYGALGSDCGTKVGDTSSGDDDLGHTDRWFTTYDDIAGDQTCPTVIFGNPNPDSSTGLPLAHNFDGPSTPPDHVDAYPEYQGLSLRGGFPQTEYDSVTLKPGQSVSYMHFEVQPTTFATNTPAAKSQAIALDLEPPELFFGMSAADRRLVRNWCIGDCDKDTVVAAKDNCKGVANPGQLNSDGDARGDACDPDDDNDGRSDALEKSLGTSPTNPKDAPPRVTKLIAPAQVKVGTKALVRARARDDYGVRRVTFFAGNTRICSDRKRPFRCTWKPASRGRRTLTAIASDAIGQVGARSKSIQVTR